jgi:hypothetical protein
MPAKIIAAALPNVPQAPPFARHLRDVARGLLGRFTRAAGTADRALVLEDRVAIGPKKSLVVVRCHGQRFLVATAGDTIGPLIKLAAPRARRAPRKERGA